MRSRFKQMFKKVFNLLGYELTRLPQRSMTSVLQPSTQIPYKIEFIGPSGVGKSTIIREMERLKGKKDKWIVANSLLQTAMNHPTLYFQTNIYDELLNLYSEQMMARPVSIRKKIVLLRYYLKQITEEETINKIAGDTFVVFHEGLFHNGTDSIIEIEKAKPDIFEELINNRAIVHCVAEPAIILEYIKKRKEEGIRRGLLEGLSDSELLEKNLGALDKKKELINILKKYEVPCLEVNTADKLINNANKVREFINDLYFQVNVKHTSSPLK